ITMDENNIAKVDEVRCRGCGTCSSVCLSNAITLRYYRDEQLEAYIDALLAEGTVTEPSVSEKASVKEGAGG
ncbi:MAG: 4Fe-4S binding protein, partial [Promethearchaeota archaeon]